VDSIGRGSGRKGKMAGAGAVAALAILVALFLSPETEARQRISAAGASSVFARSLSDPWVATRGSDFEGIVLLASGRVHTPTRGRGRVVLTLTLDFRSSQGDWGLVSGDIRRVGSRRGIVMRPGGFRVASSSRTTTTLTWVKKDLSRGADYVVEVSVRARDGDGDASARVLGQKLTFAARAN
jgi:hypothetical protein